MWRLLYRTFLSRSGLSTFLNQTKRFENPLLGLEDCSPEVAPKRRIFLKALLKLRVGVVVLEVRVVSAVELPVVGFVVLEGRGVCLVDRLSLVESVEGSEVLVPRKHQTPAVVLLLLVGFGFRGSRFEVPPLANALREVVLEPIG